MRLAFGSSSFFGAAALAVSVAAAQSSDDRQIAPELLGWNSAALDRVFDYAKSLGTDSLVIVTHGAVVDLWATYISVTTCIRCERRS